MIEALLIAQQGLVRVERLEGGPAWEVWLLERSLLTGAALVLAAILGWFFLTQAGKRRAAIITSSTLVVLGIGVLVLGRAVETDRERLEALTRAFVEEFVAGETAALEAMISERVALLSAGRGVSADRDLLIGASRGTPIDDFSYSSMGSTLDSANIGKTRFSVQTTHSGLYSGRVSSAWELDWQRAEDGRWRIITFECLHVFNRPPGDEWVQWARRVSR